MKISLRPNSSSDQKLKEISIITFILHLLGSILAAKIVPNGGVNSKGVKNAMPQTSYFLINSTSFRVKNLNLIGLGFLGKNL